MKLRFDFPASIAVFLVALPLCLGIALASGVPLMAGLIAGIVGGLVVGAISGSHTSVSGPAAGLVAIVLVEVAALTEPGMSEIDGFRRFLFAVMIAGVIQVVLGVVRAGVIAYYFPTSVIRGLLAAIGLILILKQIPHAVGYDADVEGDFSFFQADGYNTITELWHMFTGFSPVAIGVSVVGLLILVGWERSPLKRSPIPAALVVVVLGVIANELLRYLWPEAALGPRHRVALGLDSTESAGLASYLTLPDFSAWQVPRVYLAAVTIAIVASLETLLNLEAVDRLDEQQRVSPPNRELVAQGIGNVCAGLAGGLPVTSVIVRSSANVYAGSKTRASAILHGIWLVGTVLLIPGLLEKIPLSALAAILLFTGYKLANPTIFRDFYRQGWNQFLPFVITVFAIVFTDLLIGILIGLAVGIFFVLQRMERSPFLKTQKKPVPGDVTRLKLGQQVTFLSRARVLRMLDQFAPGSHVILDASSTHYIDTDVLELIREFRDIKAPANEINVSLVGFRDQYSLQDDIRYSDVFTPELQASLTPAAALQMLRHGNHRYLHGEMIDRDWGHQRTQTAASQHPIAALLGCIDSRVPAELVFDVGIGDVFSTRVAGNVVNDDVLGSLEYASEVAGVKLIVVLGHTRCGAVGAACSGVELGHVTGLIEKIRPSVEQVAAAEPGCDRQDPVFVDAVTRANVRYVMHEIISRSELIRRRTESGGVGVVGGLYDIKTGVVDFFGEFVDRLEDAQDVTAPVATDEGAAEPRGV